MKTNVFEADLERAEKAGIDTSVERRRLQLMEDNPKMSHAVALARASREARKVAGEFGGMIQCRMSRDFMRRIDLYRAKNGMTVSDVVRNALHGFVP